MEFPPSPKFQAYPAIEPVFTAAVALKGIGFLAHAVPAVKDTVGVSATYTLSLKELAQPKADFASKVMVYQPVSVILWALIFCVLKLLPLEKFQL